MAGPWIGPGIGTPWSPSCRESSADIQNPASWLAALVIDPQPNERILDLCAAPGGKTSHLAAMSNNQAHITANDNSYGRLQRLKANCKRLGAEIDEFTLFDASSISKKLEGREFDKILIDAPCSGEGMMRYDIDKDFASWSVAHIKRLQGLQKQMIKQAWKLLSPGGYLVYSTCTIAPEENEAVIDYALRSLDDARLAPTQLQLENSVPPVREWNGRSFNADLSACLRLKPSKDMHAFFVAKLQKLQQMIHTKFDNTPIRGVVMGNL